MKKILFASVATASLLFAATVIAQPAVQLGLDQIEKAPPSHSGHIFQPSYGFPSTLPTEPRPWEAISFQQKPNEYLDAVMAYVLEGQDTAHWDVGTNAVRKWYHMPWMGPGGKGREYTHGLTSERRSQPGELSPQQTKCRQNWAVGFYNPIGGFTLGKVWKPLVDRTGNSPDLTGLPFPEGTVVAKALYTEADATDTPLLQDAPTIEANIVRDDNQNDNRCPDDVVNGQPAPREKKTLRLLQFDVAVRDPNATTTGWVFATFVYDGREAGSDPWKKLKPVGLMWGNDPELSDTAAQAGQKPVEGIVFSTFGISRNFGRGGRMNGPVDNPNSACLSCHMTAQNLTTANMAPPSGSIWDTSDSRNVKCWFRNLGPTTPFGDVSNNACGSFAPGRVSLDYSLQLAVGVRNVAIAAQNARPQGFRLFGNSPASPDKKVKIDGVKTLPVGRE